MKSNLVLLLLLASAIALGSGYLWLARGFRAPSAPVDTVATVLSTPIPLPDFELGDQLGRPFTRESLLGEWSFLFFGYTHCPDVCPTTLVMLNRVAGLLQETATSPRPQVVFIAVDPERDTPGVLTDYLAHFNPEFLGVTGPEAQLQVLTRPLGIMHQRSPAEDTDGTAYLVDHTASILLVGPRGQLRALMSPPHDADVIAADYRKIVAAGSPRAARERQQPR